METTTELFSPSERDRVLQAVTELCATHSYGEITIAQVVERAGVSAEAFDSIFAGDLEECMLAAMNMVVGDVVSAVSSSYSADLSEWDSGLLAVKAILELMAARPSYAHLAYIGSRQMAPPKVREAYGAGIQVLTAMIERLWEYSAGDAQPAAAARGALGAAEAVVRREVMAGRTEHLPSLLPDFIYGATVPFLGQEEALRHARRARELLRGTAWG